MSAVAVGMAVGLGHGLAGFIALVCSILLLLMPRSWYFNIFLITSGVMFFSPATGSLHVAASDLLLPLMLIGAFINRSGGGTVNRVLAFYGFMLASAAMSAVYAQLHLKTFDAYLAISSQVKFTVVILYLVSVVALAPRDSRSLRSTFRVWSAAATLQAALCSLNLMGISVFPGSAYRTRGLFDDPNLLSGFFLISIIVLLWAHAVEPVPELLPSFTILCLGLLAAASRSALATLVVVVIGVLILTSSQFRALKAYIALLALATLAGGSAFILSAGEIPAVERLSGAFQEVGDDSRLSLWGRAVELWQASPFVGVGPGLYPLYSGDIMGISGRTGTGFVAHNSFLTLLAEQGLVGMLVATAGFVAILRVIRCEPARDVRVAMILGVTVLGVQMATLNLQSLRYVWIFMGFVLVWGIGSSRPWVSTRQPMDRSVA
ncbi:O-antigen ligase family protein [Nocardioides bruguierae]|uniref:O-antigen ligase family protein n=1 Tax=Nocardioides bruguierae TaxID=2945102 RepID=UPI00201FBC3E|nr:O-antigen ligase family protein [Nocardioides bruguierae]MCL8026274.1 O-antigen ligase family protein [Nocardioides bruguierae]